MARQSVKSENFASDNDRILFTVKDRSVLTKACLHEGGWEGTRKGHKITLCYDKGAPRGQQVVWGVSIGKAWRQGTAANIFDAMGSVEQKVANKEWDERETKLNANAND